MKVYRCECEDGGGPFYKLDGTPRNPNMPTFKNSQILYGADSIENLKQLITNYGFKFDNYILKEYNIIENNIISYNKLNGHIIFKGEQNVSNNE